MAIFKYLIVLVLDKEHDSTSSNRFGEMAVNVKEYNHVLSTGEGCKSDRRTLIFWYLHDGIRLRIGPISSYMRYKNGFLGILPYSPVCRTFSFLNHCFASAVGTHLVVATYYSSTVLARNGKLEDPSSKALERAPIHLPNKQVFSSHK